MTRIELKAYGALLVGATSIAFSAIFVRWAGVPGVVAGFYRQAIGLAVLAPLFVVRLRHTRHSPSNATPQAVWIALLAGLFFAGDLGTWNTSVLHTTAANATLLANTAPVYVGLGTMLLFGERLGASFWVGLGVALVGAALIVGADLRGAAGMGFGDLLALIAGVCYGLYQLTISRARRGIDTLSSAWLANLTGGLALLVVSVGLGHALAGFELRQWLALLAMGVISQALGYLGINYALGKLPAPIVSATLLSQPVMTALLSIPLLDEGLSMAQVIGGLVTLIGIYMVNRGRAVPRET
jgi:drug/metabolite transporter (DMT)-like permease